MDAEDTPNEVCCCCSRDVYDVAATLLCLDECHTIPGHTAP
jgi:hypothetical protein